MVDPRELAPEKEPQEDTPDPNEMARMIVQTASDKKAEDIVMLDIRELSIISDYFVICTGTSDRQVRAIAHSIDEQIKKSYGVDPIHVEGLQEATWALLDYGGVIVHIFDPETRDYYRLEKLWAAAPRILVVQ